MEMQTVSRRRALGAAVVAALALSGLLAVVSSGDAAPIAKSASIKLVVDACTDQNCRAYPIAKGAEYNAVNLRVRDVDGQTVGRSRCSCLFSSTTGSVCDMVVSLRYGPHTANGTITATGLHGHTIRVTRRDGLLREPSFMVVERADPHS